MISLILDYIKNISEKRKYNIVKMWVYLIGKICRKKLKAVLF